MRRVELLITSSLLVAALIACDGAPATSNSPADGNHVGDGYQGDVVPGDAGVHCQDYAEAGACGADSECVWCATMQVCIPATRTCDCRLFLTSKVYFVNRTGSSEDSFVGLAGADQRCAEHAEAVTLSGTWKTLISTSAIDAKSRFSATQVGKVLSFGGEVLAVDYADLWDGAVLTEVLYDELGGTHSGGGAWTGSNAVGEKAADHMCSDWTSSTGSANIGHAGAVSAWFEYPGDFDCSGLRGLYCMSCE